MENPSESRVSEATTTKSFPPIATVVLYVGMKDKKIKNWTGKIGKLTQLSWAIDLPSVVGVWVKVMADRIASSLVV